jgi:hypothetical protein
MRLTNPERRPSRGCADQPQLTGSPDYVQLELADRKSRTSRGKQRRLCARSGHYATCCMLLSTTSHTMCNLQSGDEIRALNSANAGPWVPLNSDQIEECVCYRTI